jgi:endonuclease/exonuclease/phosphatase family metal-dependent hydrolase
MPLSLMTLNVESDRHVEGVRSVIAEHRPDIVCLQEALEKDCTEIARQTGYALKYVLATRVERLDGTLDGWGVAVLTRVPVQRQTVSIYSENTAVGIHREPNDFPRLLLVTELEHEGRPYRIGTTHFTWSAKGQVSDLQLADFARLQRVLSEYPDYVLCGDFNAPRGRPLFSKFIRELGLTDHLPPSVTSTIDGRLHRDGALELVVDTVFSTAEYRVSGVRVIDGVSDHKAILATVERS